MKETTPIDTISPATVIEQQVIKQKKVHTLKPYPGRKVFEMNCSTGEIKEAEMQQTSAAFDTGAIKSKVIMKEHCRYVCAINIANAEKKLFKSFK